MCRTIDSKRARVAVAGQLNHQGVELLAEVPHEVRVVTGLDRLVELCELVAQLPNVIGIGALSEDGGGGRLAHDRSGGTELLGELVLAAVGELRWEPRRSLRPSVSWPIKAYP